MGIKFQQKANCDKINNFIICLVFNDSTFVGLQLQTKVQSSFMLEMLARVLRTCKKFYAFEMHVYYA